LRGTPKATYGLLVATLAPGALFSLVLSYRQRVVLSIKHVWGQFAEYPSQTKRIPWLATLSLVVLPSGLLFLARESNIVAFDSGPVVPTAVSLVTHGDCDISSYVDLCGKCYSITDVVEDPYFAKRAGLAYYSAYPAGMVPFAVPSVAIARLLHADFNDMGTITRIEKWTASWVAALALGLFFLIALHVVDPAPAAIMTLILATGSVVYTTIGQGLWQHGGVILWGLLVFLLELDTSDRIRLSALAAQGFACAMMLACRPTAGTFAVSFTLWLSLRSPRRGVIFASATLVAYLPWALFYQLLYGSIIGPTVSQTAMTNWQSLSLDSVAKVLFSPGRGVFVYQPWLALSIIGLIGLVCPRAAIPSRVPLPRGCTLFCLAFAATHLAVISSWKCWWGGHCWGSRLASEAVVFAALLCLKPTALLWAMPMGRRLVLAVALASSLFHIPAVYLRQDRWNTVLSDSPAAATPRLCSWSDPPFLYGYTHRR
jgi:hypothetical protein